MDSGLIPQVKLKAVPRSLAAFKGPIFKRPKKRERQGTEEKGKGRG